MFLNCLTIHISWMFQISEFPTKVKKYAEAIGTSIKRAEELAAEKAYKELIHS